MAQFISIATVVAGNPVLQLNVNMITHVAYASATSVVVYMGTRTVTLTIAGATTTNFYNAVLAAIASQVPAPLIEVALPTGVTVTTVVVA